MSFYTQERDLDNRDAFFRRDMEFHQKNDQAEEICHAIPAFHRKLYVAIEKQNPVDAKLLMTDHIVKFNDEFLLSQEG